MTAPVPAREAGAAAALIQFSNYCASHDALKCARSVRLADSDAVVEALLVVTPWLDLFGAVMSADPEDRDE
jgi:hypothetical protein